MTRYHHHHFTSMMPTIIIITMLVVAAAMLATSSPVPAAIGTTLNNGGGGITEEPSVSSRGGHCGGFLVPAPVCDSGLQCHCSGNVCGDVGGVCVRDSDVQRDLGDSCDTSALRFCRPGLHCSSTDGTCHRTYARAGGHCGGNKLYPVLCTSGLHCKSLSHTMLPVQEIGGTCVVVASQGESCNGKIFPPVLCDDGLTCIETNGHGDGGAGVCKPVATPGHAVPN